MTKTQIDINKKYIDLVNDVYIDERGNPVSDDVKPFVDIIYEEVIDSGLMLEFKSDWRSKARINIDEEISSSFVRECVNYYSNGDIQLDTFAQLIKQHQVAFGKYYKKEHIDALLDDAPVEIRQKHAEHLTEVIEATSNVFSTREIIYMLIDGALESVCVFNTNDKRIREIPNHKFCDEILSNKDKIDLNKDVFYNGSKDITVLDTGLDSKIGNCVAKSVHGHNFPYLLSKKDPVNSKISEVVIDSFI